MDSAIYEKLGLFYLGKRWDLDSGEITDEPILYDSKDLNTHAVCVGMTGSGKTGLCIGLLEEAIIDQIPVLAIDVKGDITNLMLTFPEMKPEDFQPWIDPAEATAKGKSPEDYAASTAEMWKKGIGSWGQDGERVRKLKESAEFTVFTPGSSAGMPISVLKSFDAPHSDIVEDAELFGDKIDAAVTGILSLVGIKADPVQSREYILLSQIFKYFWAQGASISLQTMIKTIQNPPFDTIGIMEVETVFPSKDRLSLAMAINNLFASPSFAAWLKGEPMDIQRLLWSADGKPRCSIISIAHLSEKERMFFVSLLLNEVVSWMRSQTGTGSLRAVLYMDEVFGYFPPVSNPPSKKPMLTLLKQARAFGLGVVLATQNPVDLDYKGLSNTGTWFIGRLQTERDKERVLDGLESANTSSGKTFDRGELDKLISGLGKRVFLMNNVHENEHVLFHTRWVLSYLRGPLTRRYIEQLMEHRAKEAGKPVLDLKADVATVGIKPKPPEGMGELYLFNRNGSNVAASNTFAPGIVAKLRLHYADKRRDLDHWSEKLLALPLPDDVESSTWNELIDVTNSDFFAEEEGPEKGTFTDLPKLMTGDKAAKEVIAELEAFAYRALPLALFKCDLTKLISEPGESKRDFLARQRQALSEIRDQALEKLRDKFKKKAESLEKKIHTAHNKVEREKSQYDQSKLQTVISLGSSLLGQLMGRKRSMTTTARGVGRSMRERGDYKRSQQSLQLLMKEREELERELQEELSELQDNYSSEAAGIDTTEIPPRKSDIEVTELNMLWIENGATIIV